MQGERRRVDVPKSNRGLDEGRKYDYLMWQPARRTRIGHDEWARVAPGLKTLEDALTVFFFGAKC